MEQAQFQPCNTERFHSFNSDRQSFNVPVNELTVSLKKKSLSTCLGYLQYYLPPLRSFWETSQQVSPQMYRHKVDPRPYLWKSLCHLQCRNQTSSRRRFSDARVSRLCPQDGFACLCPPFSKQRIKLDYLNDGSSCSECSGCPTFDRARSTLSAYQCLDD